MTPAPTSDLRAAFLAKGFLRDNTHHEMYWFHFQGRKTSVRTRISHGMSEYDDNLLGLVAKQVGLTRAELDQLVACPLTSAAYGALLLQRGRVTPAEPRPSPVTAPAQRKRAKPRNRKKR
jgi:hypothetical protein